MNIYLISYKQMFMYFKILKKMPQMQLLFVENLDSVTTLNRS